VLSSRLLSAQEPLKAGKVLQRTDVAGAKGMEAILVLRELPAGAESGKHTQSGTVDWDATTQTVNDMDFRHFSRSRSGAVKGCNRRHSPGHNCPTIAPQA
jgi:hypothetical protein